MTTSTIPQLAPVEEGNPITDTWVIPIDSGVQTFQATVTQMRAAILAQGTALSVLGVAGNATGVNASIAAGTDHHVLRRSGTALGFGLLTNDNIDAAAAIAGSKIAPSFTSDLTVSASEPAIILAATDTSEGTDELIATQRVTSADPSNTGGIASEIRTVSNNSTGSSTRMEFHLASNGVLGERATLNNSSNFSSGSFTATSGSFTASVGNFVSTAGYIGNAGQTLNTHSAIFTRRDGSANACGSFTKDLNSTATTNNFIAFGINDNSGNSGRIAANGANTAAFQTTSDERLKFQIQSYSGGLEKITALRPVNFKWKSHPSEQCLGFIAQEVERVIPSAVTPPIENPDDREFLTDDEGKVLKDREGKPRRNEKQTPDYMKYYSMCREEFIPHMVSAIIELNEKVKQLENQLANR